MNTRTQLWGAYLGFALVFFFLLGWGVVAGFVPPPIRPTDGPIQIAEHFREQTTRIRLGITICLYAAALVLPFYATLTCLVKRIEGRYSPIAYIQLLGGALLAVEFMVPLFLWATAAFRPEETPEILQRFDDAAWLPFFGAVSFTIVQCIALGIAILRDEHPKPVFPRWLAYFNFWCALSFTPGSGVIFFKDGPFAWTGIMTYWLVLVMFCIWLVVMSWAMIKAVKNADAEDPQSAPGTTGRDQRVLELESQVALLTARMDRLSAGHVT